MLIITSGRIILIVVQHEEAIIKILSNSFMLENMSIFRTFSMGMTARRWKVSWKMVPVDLSFIMSRYNISGCYQSYRN